ncbi:MAG: M15 family metallopeptidase [Ginsengibacter sp.]
MNDKVTNQRNINRIFFVIFSTLLMSASATQALSQNTLQVTNNVKDYRKQVKDDPDKKMIELKSLIPSLVYDIRYATTNNFMHRLMYPAKTNYTFLRLPAAQNLLSVEKELNTKGLGLKIFDAYRPYSVTKKFWNLVHDERYVANPAKGSGHNKGIAVDLTIINLVSGKELDMGTGFDNFTDSAHQTFTALPEEVLQNRILLKSTMGKYGFKALETEWWHYYLINGDKFKVLDIDFKKMKKLN